MAEHVGPPEPVAPIVIAPIPKKVLTGDLTWYSLGTPCEIPSLVSIAPLPVSWPIQPHHYGKTIFPSALIRRVKSSERTYQNVCMTCPDKECTLSRFTGIFCDYDCSPPNEKSFNTKKNTDKRASLYEHTCTMACQMNQISRGFKIIVIPVRPRPLRKLRHQLHTIR